MKSALGLVVFICCSLSLAAQSFLTRTGDQITNEEGDTMILRGMGLGGWMLQEGYMFQMAEFAGAQWQIEQHIEDLIGTDGKEAFYDAWYQNHVTKADIDSMAAWGFNLVRLPMHYNLFTLSIQEEPVRDENTWLERGITMTDSLVSWCRANNMYILLDLHAAPGGQGANSGISDYNPAYPSLWEDNANKRKTIALWRRLAEHYADEPVIAGYDLLNEPNWNLPGGAALRALYGEITNAIREVDENHLLFIEGNWFANDFTGLTVPWDDKMVYSPHKYWSNNETEDLRWVLDIRESTGYPIYFGESGENSNTWFRDAIKNFEDNGMGWAWWPEKKVEDIAGPLSITKTSEYERLLNFWKGNGPRPSVQEATETLMQLTEDLKIENCFVQKDVLDAMFRQPYSDEVLPFNTQEIPGVVFSSEYDMGRNGFAYFDTEVANYELSTGNFTAWNSGWTYRNDGVDLERNTDNVNSNGYNVGFMEGGEWIQYSVDVKEEGIYNVNVRYAAGAPTGEYHLSTNNGALTETQELNSTFGWASWRTHRIENVVLTEADEKLIFHVDNEGFNMSSMEFVKVGELTDVPTEYICAGTEGDNTIAVTVNKPLNDTDNITAADFIVVVNGRPFDVSSVLVEQNNKTFHVTVDNIFSNSHIINVTYNGTAISAVDGTLLEPFSQELVKNNVLSYLTIPGQIEAEDFVAQTGIELEETTDNGGGMNIGFLDVGDYADYLVDVDHAGTYQVEYRTASQGSTGGVELFLVEGEQLTSLHRVSFQQTGAWQSWRSTTKEVELQEGRQQLRVVITQPMFNLNWFRFGSVTSTDEIFAGSSLDLFPNPFEENLTIAIEQDLPHELQLELRDLGGKLMSSWQVAGSDDYKEILNLKDLDAGVYFLSVQSESGWHKTEKIVKL